MESSGAATVTEIHTRSLADLPAEMIFAIVDKTDIEAITLLSISCKRLYLLLAEVRKASFPNLASKFRFLQLYERDLPDHLTCRSCVRLYKWDLFLKQFPHTPHPSECAIPTGPLTAWFRITPAGIKLPRELIDVVLKADEQGGPSEYPISCLNTHATLGAESPDYHTTIESRLVKEELLVAACITKEVSKFKKALRFGSRLCSELCPHSYQPHSCQHRYSPRFWISYYLPSTRDFLEPLETNLIKCECCRTQYRVSIRGLPLQQCFQIQIKVWKSFGTRHENSTSINQMFFCDDNAWRSIIDMSLSQRDLQATFESALTS